MKAFYCVGTHWDREWYEPFQEFRMWLVELIDELIDLMERDPGYKHFHLDGQAIVIDDYLAIRPERRERLMKLLKDGRIVAGPWYNLPDEWLISGESYVRNLMKGMRTCREYGFEPLKFAYTPDQFGHIAALPTIMAGFGLETGIVWRGTQDENYPAHFVWVGPDGSRMVTHKLMDKGSYAPFDFLARGPIKRSGFAEESYKEHFEPYIKEETSRTSVPLVLMLDAIDHQASDPEMPKLFDELVRRYPDIEFTWGTLEQYAAELQKHKAELPERTGELREPALDAFRVGQYLIVHTISSRYPVKMRNDRCTALLEKWAEPYALFHRQAGGEPIVRYLDLAWEYLLKNHPHDSICGCSIDQVHQDMIYRFDQSELIADGLIRRAMTCMGDASDGDAALANVVVHNPLAHKRHGVFDVPVHFTGEWAKRYIDGLASSELLNKFTIKGADGQELPFQLVSIDRGIDYKRLRSNGRKRHAGGDIYHLAVEMDLPSCGFTGFTVEPSDLAVRNFGTQRHAPLGASNGLVTVNVDTDGSVELTHDATGATYGGLFLYEDSGDSGDGWTRGPLVDDLVVTSYGTRVTTAIEEDGPLRTVFRIEREFELPAKMERKTFRRSDERETFRVTDRLYVEKGLAAVRVRTTVENNVLDHRLRVLFPTDLFSEESFADTPFAIVRRPIVVPPETARWHERVNPEKAFTSMCGVEGTIAGDDDGVCGLAVLSPHGLHEYEVTQTDERSLAITLFRSTYRTVATAGEPAGELQGTLEFEYLIYPFVGPVDPAAALRLVAELQAGVRTHNAESMPKTRSFANVEGDACVVSALKPASDGRGGIVRLWNPGDTKATARVRFEQVPAKAERCNLNEESIEPLAVDDDGWITLKVAPRALTTARVEWTA